MKPAISILNPARPYVASHMTDIRKTFAKHREQQQAAAAPKQTEYVSTIIQLFNERREQEK